MHGSLFLRTGSCLLALAFLLVSGCGVFRELHETPDPYPDASGYEEPLLQNRLRNLAVALDMSDFKGRRETMISYRGMMGGRDNGGTFDVKAIVEKEFSRLIDENFRRPVGDEQAAVLLKVTSKKLVVEKRWSRTDCDMAFEVSLIDPQQELTRPYHQSVYDIRKSGAHRARSHQVPLVIYQSVQDVAASFIHEFAQERQKVNRLMALARAPTAVENARLRSMKYENESASSVRGRCEIDCNGEEPFQADQWARSQIREQCRGKLGLPLERVRIVFPRSDYDERMKRWFYQFVAYARTPLFMDYDPATRRGICIGDLGLLKVSAEEASLKMQNYVKQEMRVRTGIVVDGTAGDAAKIRFDAFTTERETETVRFSFRLVY